MEPQQHLLNYSCLGGPSVNIDMASPFFWNFVFIELPPATVPSSITVAPTWSALCFPDLYIPNLFSWDTVPAPGGFGTFATPVIPNSWCGKLLFQSLAFGGSGIELSTPTVIDVN